MQNTQDPFANNSDDLDWYGAEDTLLSDPDFPHRLRQFDQSEIQDPNAALEIIEILQEELESAGKRTHKIAIAAQEGLDYLFDLYPEFQNEDLQSGKSVDAVEIDQPFKGETNDERLVWLHALHINWLAKQREDDSQVSVVDSPTGDGYALQHENSELGFVKTDLSNPDLSTGTIATFETAGDAKATAEKKGLKEVPTDQSSEEKAETYSPPNIKQGLRGKQLSLFDTIEFVNPKPIEERKEFSRDEFSAKALEILDGEKRWPKLGGQPMNGWDAMQLAVDKGFVAEKSETTPVEYRISQETEGVSIRIKKAEYDVFTRLPNVASVQDLKNDQSPDEPQENKQEKLKTLHMEIGRKAFPDLKLTEKDAEDAGRTFEMVKSGPLNDSDWQYYSDRLREQYQNVSVQVQNNEKTDLRDQFSEKALTILDSEKRWPKLSDEPMSGWKAMETALEQDFHSAVRKKDEGPTEYFLLNDQGGAVRVKKAEHDYFEKIASKGNDDQLIETTLEETRNPVKELLADLWPSPSSLISKYEVILTNAGSESHKKTISEVLADLKENQSEAEVQMKSNGFLDDKLGSMFHSLPSEFSFSRDLLNGKLAKAPGGSVFEISKESQGDNEVTFVVIQNLFDESKNTIRPAVDEQAWSFADAVQVAAKTAGYPPKENRQETEVKSEAVPEPSAPVTKKELEIPAGDKDIHRMSFKEFLLEIHGIDPSDLKTSDQGKPKQVGEYIQEWGSAIIEAAHAQKEIPASNIKSFQGAVEQDLLKVENKQSLPEILRPAGLENESQDKIFYDYGVQHPRGVGMGASPHGHVQYNSDTLDFSGGIVTYDRQLSEEDVTRHSYAFIGTRKSLEDQPQLDVYKQEQSRERGRKEFPNLELTNEDAEQVGRASEKYKIEKSINEEEWKTAVSEVIKKYTDKQDSEQQSESSVTSGKKQSSGQQPVFDDGFVPQTDLTAKQPEPVSEEPTKVKESSTSSGKPLFDDGFFPDNNDGKTSVTADTAPAASDTNNESKYFYPEAEDWMWDKCVFLGKFEHDGKNYDLGVHIGESGEVSAAIVDGKKPGNYQSGGLEHHEKDPVYAETFYRWDLHRQEQKEASAAVMEAVIATKGYEMTREAFSEAIGSVDTPNPDMAIYVSTYYPETEKEKIDQQVERGDFASPADYIHKQVVKEAMSMHIEISPTVLSDYPDLKPPRPEIWEISNKELFAEPKSFQRSSEIDEQDFMKKLISGNLHKNEVSRALQEGMDVPDKATRGYPDLLQANDDSNFRM